jgi:hypothetical protein
MSNRQPIETWIVQVHRTIADPIVPTVRRQGRRSLPSVQAPDYVREYLNLAPGTARMQGLDFDDLIKPLDESDNQDDTGIRKITIEGKAASSGRPYAAWLTVHIKNPHYQPPRPKLTVKEHGPLIRDFNGLCQFFGAEGPRFLNHRIYKATDCGASISVYLKDGTTVHNGDPRWDTLTGAEKIHGFTIQTIVEGSDAEVNSDLFCLPCTQAEVTGWIADMEAQADELWKAANEGEDEDTDQ